MLDLGITADEAEIILAYDSNNEPGMPVPARGTAQRS